MFQKLGDDLGSDETKALLEKFGEEIVLEWNLHDEDAQPVPANISGWMSIPATIGIEIIKGWAAAIGTVGED